jgi:hypothetical protein
MKNIARVGFVLLSSMLMLGCMPRGETVTLAEVLASAQSRYADVSKAGVPAEVSVTLEKVTGSLSSLTTQEDLTGATEKIAALGEDIAGLVNKAGFTSRPALNEIALQYRMLGTSSGDTVTAAQVKLLASRTYSVLAAELETTKFSLS